MAGLPDLIPRCTDGARYNGFRITDPLLRKSTISYNSELWRFLSYFLEQPGEQTVEVPVIWVIMTLIL